MLSVEETGACPICGASGGSCRPEYEGGLKIIREENLMGTYTLKDRTYLDAQGKVTKDQANADSLLGLAGDEIPEEQAVRVGLMEESDPAEMSYKDLQAWAKENGEDPKQKKADLQDLYDEAHASDEDEEESTEETETPEA